MKKEFKLAVAGKDRNNNNGNGTDTSGTDTDTSTFDFNKIAGLLRDRLLERVALKVAIGDIGEKERKVRDQFSIEELGQLSAALESLVNVKMFLEEED